MGNTKVEKKEALTRVQAELKLYSKKDGWLYAWLYAHIANKLLVDPSSAMV